MSPTTTEKLRAELLDAVAAVAALAALAGEERSQRRGPEVALERPPRPELGDYSTNAALLLAPGLGEPPRDVAARLSQELHRRLPGAIERSEVAGPGFLNLFMHPRWFGAALQEILAAGESLCAGGAPAPERVLVEFVSANPTGPMHVGHARNAAYGDALARVLALQGHDVVREFYVNDAGTQVRKLGESIRALARGEEVPEDGYRGEYVRELAEGLAGSAELDPAELGRLAVAEMVASMRASLGAFGVGAFDHWIYESALHAGDRSAVEHTIAILEAHGHTYRSEGALWLRTTTYGDDKDRVLIRSDGEHTYFASDIAYHQDKRERGFQRQIDVWGADHHGYMARMKAAYEALGGDPAELEMLIMQLVHLVRRGERAQMSKRAGEFVTLDDLVAEIGVDAARWFLLSRSHDTPIDLDLDLALQQSNENPVYYVQYAHARIASVLARAGAERVDAALAGIATAPGGGGALGGGALGGGAPGGGGALGGARASGGGASEGAGAVAEPEHPAERGLIKHLLMFPPEVAEAARRRAPHRIVAYALALAQEFTAFYRDCHVLDVQPVELESLRIGLCVATQRTIATALGLLGVSAPEEM